MKKFLFAGTGIILWALVGCHGNEATNDKTVSKDSSYAIIGKVTGLDSGTAFLIHYQSGLVDSAKLDHGYFKFNGKADTAEYCRFSLSSGGRPAAFFLENGKISILVKKDSVRAALISGTKTQDEFTYFENTFTKTVNDKMNALDAAYDKANEKKDQRVLDSLTKVYEGLEAEHKQLVTDFTKSHPASVVSAFEVYSNFNYNPRVSQLDSLYQTLDTSMRAGFFGKKIASTLASERLTGVGNPAPVFASNDVNGKPVSITALRGKYVLLDFWASWCGPCRMENPNVVKAYQKFHNMGFDIYGVSLDDGKPEWVEAIKKDGLSWTQVSDLKGWKADAVSLYGIKGIPQNYLLDKNGIIIAKGLRGAELDRKLAELIQ